MNKHKTLEEIINETIIDLEAVVNKNKGKQFDHPQVEKYYHIANLICEIQVELLSNCLKKYKEQP